MRKHYKKLIIVNTILFFLALVFIFGNFLIVLWESPSTWSGKSISFSEESNVARHSLDLFSGKNKDTFVFRSEYCYLYSIAIASDNTITLSCSLIPLSYIQTPKGESLETTRVPLSADITVVVDKDVPLPKYFLSDNNDFLHQTSASVRYPNVPVSITIKGTAVRPEKTLTSLLKHVVEYIKGEKSVLSMGITQYEFEQLNDDSLSQKEAYALTWGKSVRALLRNDFATQLSKKSKMQDKLNLFRTYFEPTAMKCSGLSTCVPEYKENPSEKVAYYMYGLHYSDTLAHANNSTLFTSGLYPFKTTYPEEPTRVWRNSVTPWTIFSVYNYSICPIAEIAKGEVNANTEVFIAYSQAIKKYGALIPSKEEFLKSSPSPYWLGVEGWDSDYIGKFDYICADMLKNSKTVDSTLKERLITVYFEMLTTQSGYTLSYNKKSIEDAIFAMSAYSPYRSPLLFDSVLTLERRKGVETFETQLKDKIEWKSFLNTLIILYLYETI